MKGIVKVYNSAKGYGFINSDEHADEIFFHVTEYIDNEPNVGQIVEFTVNKSSKGFEAKNIKLIGVTS